MSSLSKKKRHILPRSAPPGPRPSSQVREAYPDSEAERGRAYSALSPGDNHPDADSSAGGGSLFGGTPNETDRPIQQGEELLELQAPWWEGQHEDSRHRYLLSLFPKPLNTHTGVEEWTGNEEQDFRGSVKRFALPEAKDAEDAEAAAEKMWQHRVRRKVRYWLHWSAARGAYLVLHENSPARLMHLAKEEREGWELFSDDRSLLPDTEAFRSTKSTQDQSDSGSSVPVVIGGGTGAAKKGKQRTEEVGVSDRSTAGGSWRHGKLRSRQCELTYARPSHQPPSNA